MRRYQNLFLLIGVLALAVLPLWTVQTPEAGPDGEAAEIFAGADGRAMELIGEIAPGYAPWATPFFEPPSGEVESLLFALQAAIGAGFIGYYLGISAGKAERRGKADGGVAC